MIIFLFKYFPKPFVLNFAFIAVQKVIFSRTSELCSQWFSTNLGWLLKETQLINWAFQLRTCLHLGWGYAWFKNSYSICFVYSIYILIIFRSSNIIKRRIIIILNSIKKLPIQLKSCPFNLCSLSYQPNDYFNINYELIHKKKFIYRNHHWSFDVFTTIF